MSKGQVEKILYEVGHSLQEKLINTTLYAPSEFTDDIDIPTEFFEEVFKKHEFDPEDFELEEFIRDYYVAVKNFVISVLYDDVFKEYLKNYQERSIDGE